MVRRARGLASSGAVLLDPARLDLHWNAPFGRNLQYTEKRMEAKGAWVENRKFVFKSC